jgi:hypothetical protein
MFFERPPASDDCYRSFQWQPCSMKERRMQMVLIKFPCNHDKVKIDVNLILKEVHQPAGLSIAHTLFECDSRKLCGNNKAVLERKLDDLCPACMHERMHAGCL